LTAAGKLAIFRPVATADAAGCRAINPDQALIMRNLLVILAMALLPATAQAQILKCIGAGGRVEFATACPPGTKVEATGIRNNPGAASSVAERDAEFRKRRLEQQEAAKKSEEKSQENADRKQNCDSAQAYLRSLQSGQRVAKTDPKTGERVFLEDADRAAETARAQRAVESNCK
jgi:hypothetical protein